MSWSIAVHDLKDGTGARVDYVGDGATAFRIRRATVAASGYGSYADVGTALTGSGSAIVSGTGYYSWQMVNDGSGSVVAGPVYQPATHGGDSIWERLLVALTDRIAALALHEYEVLDSFWPNVVAKKFVPFISVTPSNQPPTIGDGEIEDTDILLPAMICVVERFSGPVSTRRPQFLHAVQRLQQSLCHVEPNWDYRVPEVYAVRAEPVAIVDADHVDREKLRYCQFTVTGYASLPRYDGAYDPIP